MVVKTKEIINRCDLVDCICLDEVIRACVYGYWSVLEGNNDYECVVYEFIDQWMSGWTAVDNRTYNELGIEQKSMALVDQLVELKPYVWKALGLVSHEMLRESVSFVGVERVIGDCFVLLFEYDT